MIGFVFIKRRITAAICCVVNFAFQVYRRGCAIIIDERYIIAIIKNARGALILTPIIIDELQMISLHIKSVIALIARIAIGDDEKAKITIWRAG